MNRWHNGMALKAANCSRLFALFTTSLGTVAICNIHVRHCETCNPSDLTEDYSVLDILEAK